MSAPIYDSQAVVSALKQYRDQLIDLPKTKNERVRFATYNSTLVKVDDFRSQILGDPAMPVDTRLDVDFLLQQIDEQAAKYKYTNSKYTDQLESYIDAIKDIGFKKLTAGDKKDIERLFKGIDDVSKVVSKKTPTPTPGEKAHLDELFQTADKLKEQYADECAFAKYAGDLSLLRSKCVELSGSKLAVPAITAKLTAIIVEAEAVNTQIAILAAKRTLRTSQTEEISGVNDWINETVEAVKAEHRIPELPIQAVNRLKKRFEAETSALALPVRRNQADYNQLVARVHALQGEVAALHLPAGEHANYFREASINLVKALYSAEEAHLNAIQKAMTDKKFTSIYNPQEHAAITLQLADSLGRFYALHAEVVTLNLDGDEPEATYFHHASTRLTTLRTALQAKLDLQPAFLRTVLPRVANAYNSCATKFSQTRVGKTCQNLLGRVSFPGWFAPDISNDLF